MINVNTLNTKNNYIIKTEYGFRRLITYHNGEWITTKDGEVIHTFIEVMV